MIELKETRNKLGLSQMRLAKLAGVSRYRVHLAENKYIKLTQEELRKIKKTIKTGLARIRRNYD